VEGRASARSLFTGDEMDGRLSALLSVSIDSNQNRHVILMLLVTCW
jgi:hypothetical protein